MAENAEAQARLPSLMGLQPLHGTCMVLPRQLFLKRFPNPSGILVLRPQRAIPEILFCKILMFMRSVGPMFEFRNVRITGLMGVAPRLFFDVIHADS